MTLTVPASDHGKMRVFAVTGDLPEGLATGTPAGFAAAFGAAGLDPTYVDVVNLDDLGEMTLPGYIQQGYDFTLDAVDIAALAPLTGTVVLIMSRAFAGAEVSLTLAPGITHVTTCGDSARMTVAAPLESAGATGSLSPTGGKKPKSDAAMSGRVATIALLAMFALVVLMIWVAG